MSRHRAGGFWLCLLVACAVLISEAPALAQSPNDIIRLFNSLAQPPRAQPPPAQPPRAQPIPQRQTARPAPTPAYQLHVRDAQALLNQLGYNAGPVDGLMGSGTRRALNAFQRNNGLPQTGDADPMTLVALSRAVQARASAPPTAPAPRAVSSAPASSPPTDGGIEVESSDRPWSRGSRPRGLRQVQTMLNSLGYVAGTADGVMGTRTREALAAFQADNNVPDRSGRLDQNTLQALQDAAGAKSSEPVVVQDPELMAPVVPVEFEASAQTMPAADALYVVTHKSASLTQHAVGFAVCIEPAIAEQTLNSEQFEGRKWAIAKLQFGPSNSAAENLAPYAGTNSAITTGECLEALIERYLFLHSSRGAERDDLIVRQLAPGRAQQEPSEGGAAPVVRGAAADVATPADADEIARTPPGDGELYIVAHKEADPSARNPASALCLDPGQAEEALNTLGDPNREWSLLDRQVKLAEAVFFLPRGSQVVTTQQCLDDLIEAYLSDPFRSTADANDLVVTQLAHRPVESIQGAATGTPPRLAADAAWAEARELVMLENRIALPAGKYGRGALPLGDRSLKPNAEALATAIHNGALLQGHGDIMEALDPDRLDRKDLERHLVTLPPERRERLIAFSLDLQKASDQRRNACSPEELGRRDRLSTVDCAFPRSLSAFDHRRVATELITEVAAATEEWRGVGPIEIHVVCGLTDPLDRAYDFNAGAMNWRRLVTDQSCIPQWLEGIAAARAVSIARINLPAMLPSATPMSPTQAEEFIERAKSNAGQHAVAFTFPARIVLASEGGDEGPMTSLRVWFERIGPVVLRRPQNPDDLLIEFPEPSSEAEVEVAFDFTAGKDISQFLELAQPLTETEAPQLVRAFIEQGARDQAVSIRLPAGFHAGSVQQAIGPHYRLAIPRNASRSPHAAHIASALRVPSDHVAVIHDDKTSGPLFAVAPMPIAEIIAPFDDNAGERRDAQAAFIALLDHVARLDYAGNQAMVIFMTPQHVTLTDRLNGEVIQTLEVDSAASAEIKQIFMPPPSWYAFRDTAIRGEDHTGVFASLLSGQGVGDKNAFERSAMIEAAIERARMLDEAFGTEDVWIGGTLRLSPYDAQRGVYPIASMSFAAPLVSSVDQAISSNVMPTIRGEQLVIPMSPDVAQARQADITHGRNYVFRARITLHGRAQEPKQTARSNLSEAQKAEARRRGISLPEDEPEALNPRADLLELSLATQHSSDVFVPETGYVPGKELYSVTFTPSDAIADASGGVVSDAWDILGVTLDMSIDEAERILTAAKQASPMVRLNLTREARLADRRSSDLLAPFGQGRYLAFEPGDDGFLIYDESGSGSAASLVALTRTRGFEDGLRPGPGAVMEALTAKYGEPHRIENDQTRAIWYSGLDDSGEASFETRLNCSAAVRSINAQFAQHGVLANLRLRKFDRTGQDGHEGRSGNLLTDDTGARVAPPFAASPIDLTGLPLSQDCYDEVLIVMLQFDQQGLVRQFDTVLARPGRALELSQAQAGAIREAADEATAGGAIDLDL